MAEVARVLREMQLGNDGGLVPASGSVAFCSRRRTKLAMDDSAAIGGFVGGIGVTNQDFGEIGVGKAMAVAGNKEATWSDFGTRGTNPAANKPAAKAEGKCVLVANGEGMRVPAAKEGKPEEVAMVTERVPDSFIYSLRTRPTSRPCPVTSAYILNNPKLLEEVLALNANVNKFVDLQENVLRQADAKGHADVVVKYIDGAKRVYPLPGYYALLERRRSVQGSGGGGACVG